MMPMYLAALTPAAVCLLQGYDVPYYAEAPPRATGCILKVPLDAQTGAMGASSRWVHHRGVVMGRFSTAPLI
jgi:hypothetical protein